MKLLVNLWKIQVQNAFILSKVQIKNSSILSQTPLQRKQIANATKISIDHAHKPSFPEAARTVNYRAKHKDNGE